MDSYVDIYVHVWLLTMAYSHFLSLPTFHPPFLPLPHPLPLFSLPLYLLPSPFPLPPFLSPLSPSPLFPSLSPLSLPPLQVVRVVRDVSTILVVKGRTSQRTQRPSSSFNSSTFLSKEGKEGFIWRGVRRSRGSYAVSRVHLVRGSEGSKGSFGGWKGAQSFIWRWWGSRG